MTARVFVDGDANRSALHEPNVATVTASRRRDAVPRYPNSMPANVMLYSYDKFARASSVTNSVTRANDPTLDDYHTDFEYLHHMMSEIRPVGVGGVTASHQLEGNLDNEGLPVVVSETARRVRQCDDGDAWMTCFPGALAARRHMSLGPVLLYCVPTSKTRSEQLYTNRVKSPRTADCPTMRLVPLQLPEVRLNVVRAIHNDENPPVGFAQYAYVDYLGFEHAELRAKGLDPVVNMVPGDTTAWDFFGACGELAQKLPTALQALVRTQMFDRYNMQSSRQSARLCANSSDLHLIARRVAIAGQDVNTEYPSLLATHAASAAAVGGAAGPARAAGLRDRMRTNIARAVSQSAWHRVAEAFIGAVRAPVFCPVGVSCGAFFREAVDAYVFPRPNLFPERAVLCAKLRGNPIESGKVTVGIKRDNQTHEVKDKPWDGDAMLLVYRVMTDDGDFEERTDVGVIDVAHILNSGLYETLVHCAWNLVTEAVPAAAGAPVDPFAVAALPAIGARAYAQVPNKELLHREIMKRTYVVGGTNMDSLSVRTPTLTALLKGGTGLRCASVFSAYARDEHPFATQMRIRAPLTRTEQDHCRAWADLTMVDRLSQTRQFDENKHFVPILTTSVEPARFYTEVEADVRRDVLELLDQYNAIGDDAQAYNSIAPRLLSTIVGTHLIAATITNQLSMYSRFELEAPAHANEANRRAERKLALCSLTATNLDYPFPYRNVLPLSVVDVMRPDWSKEQTTPLTLRVVYTG
jgi:hypothetical protein